MPIRWKISHDEKLVTVRAEGPVVLQDFVAYFDDIIVSDAIAYRKFFDASGIEPQFSDDDVMQLGARASAYAAIEPRGPLAVVVNTDAGYALAARFMNLASARRPANIFWSVGKAQKWLDAQTDVTKPAR
jgi:hypothetical protein